MTGSATRVDEAAIRELALQARAILEAIAALPEVAARVAAGDAESAEFAEFQAGSAGWRWTDLVRYLQEGNADFCGAVNGLVSSATALSGAPAALQSVVAPTLDLMNRLGQNYRRAMRPLTDKGELPPDVRAQFKTVLLAVAREWGLDGAGR